MAYKITNVVPSVTKFFGRKEGQSTCDLEGFLSQLDDYLASKPGLSESERLAEAKQFIDTSKGDIYTYTSTHKYRVLIKSYHEFKSYLRTCYATVTDVDPITALGLIFSKYRHIPPDLKDASPRIYYWISEWVNSVQSSFDPDLNSDDVNWLSTNEAGMLFMELETVGALLRLALMLGTCHPHVLQKLDKTWNKYHDLNDILLEVRKHNMGLPEMELKPTINAMVSSSSTGIQQPHKHNQQRNQFCQT